MKRLKNKLLAMDPTTCTYKEMYEGSIRVIDPVVPDHSRQEEYDSVYYNGEIGFQISFTHKLAQDKPTITIQIPCDKLGIDEPDDAAADFCLRAFWPYLDGLNEELFNRNRPNKETGAYVACRPGNEILKRNASYFARCPRKDYEYGAGSTVYLLSEKRDRVAQLCLCLTVLVQLPQKNLRKTIRMLCRDLPNAVDRFVAEMDHDALQCAIMLHKKQREIRAWLKNSEYCAFLANGSILPRFQNTARPLADAVPFQAVPDKEIELFGIRGMGIKKGVTVISGGGYSGKSTLLDAISAGIYDHIGGDGREFCITDAGAVTVCVEEGRSIKHTNISPFLKWSPDGDPADFSTRRASGSTSQAANVAEAVDGGATLLLIDEDRSATNFMIRDRVMQTLIPHDPITPFTERVNELYRRLGVSTILVVGGSGEYFPVADEIYLVENYQIHDVTEKYKTFCGPRDETGVPDADWTQHKVFYSEGFTARPAGEAQERLEVLNGEYILIGDEKIEIRGLHNLVSPYQINALALILRYLESQCNKEEPDLAGAMDALYLQIEKNGLDFLYSSYFTTCDRFLDCPRKQEVFAVLQRMRNVRIERGKTGE